MIFRLFSSFFRRKKSVLVEKWKSDTFFLVFNAANDFKCQFQEHLSIILDPNLLFNDFEECQEVLGIVSELDGSKFKSY